MSARTETSAHVRFPICSAETHSASLWVRYARGRVRSP